MTLPKSIQPKNNKSYDGLITVVTDPLVCGKLKFAEMLSWKFDKFDNPMVPFLYVTLERFLRWLREKNILKETFAKADSGRQLLKINPKDVNIQKPADQGDIGSAAQLQIAEYKKKATYQESKVYTFRKEVTVLYATTASHFMEKSPLKSSIVQYAVCFDIAT